MSNIVHSMAWALQRLAGPAEYPPAEAAPYAPAEAYPEFPEIACGRQPNPVFSAVRGVLADLGLDAARFGTRDWNPLGALTPPGGKIVVKPNWVLDRNLGSGGMDCMISHPAVLRAVLEYVFLAQPAQVVLGDAPLQGCVWEAMQDFGGLRAVVAEFHKRGLPLVVKDFRRTVMREADGLKQVSEELHPESDYLLVDLGADSLLEPISKDWKKFRVTVYDPRKMRAHHRQGRHRFLIARDILEADLVVNVPKLKAHKKAGITCCLKNLIGINGNKEYLPHHRKGARRVGRGGDSHENGSWLLWALETALDGMNLRRDWPRFYRLCEYLVYGVLRVYRWIDPQAQLEGSWHGNDTIWRTCLDLNRALLYADQTGRMQELPQREEISIVDAIVAGQGEGPLAPDPLQTGAVFAARNPAVGDLLGARLLGFDVAKIPLLRHACDDMRWRICRASPDFPVFHPPFPAARPPQGWAGHLELGQ